MPPCLPTYQGFDSYFGIPYSNDMWRDPANKIADDIVLREGVTAEPPHRCRSQAPPVR